MVRVTKIELVDRLYLVGAPGIGKTEIIKQKAMEEAKAKNKVFVDLREAKDEELEKIMANPERYYGYYRIIATHVFPEDLGIPKQRDNCVEFIPPKVLKVLSTEGLEGVLFIDELSNVQRDDQISMLYSLIQEKEVSWMLRLSRNIKIIAAGNSTEWSEIVRVLPKPLRNRLTIVRVDPPTTDEWINYMEKTYGDDWEKLTAVYLKAFPEDLIRPPESDEENFPSPRAWTELAVLLHKYSDNEEFKEELVIGRLGKAVGARFLALMRAKTDVARLVEDLAEDPTRFNSLRTEQKVLAMYSLAQKPVSELKKYAKLLEYLSQTEREMLVLMLVLMPREKRAQVLKELKDVTKNIVTYLAKVLV